MGAFEFRREGIVSLDAPTETLPAPEPVATVVPPAPAQIAPAPRTAQPKPLDVIKLAHRRLRAVRAEIKRLEKLRKEEKQLSRMLDAAADRNNQAIVRDIRRASS
jgi:hypothetical protein